MARGFHLRSVLLYDPSPSVSRAGTGELYVNGKKVDQIEMPRMHISTYSLAETFDIGIDDGAQVDPNYEGSPFPFKGDLDRVKITLTD